MKKNIFILSLGLLFIFSCGDGKKEEDVKSGDKVFTIGMSQCNLGEPWRVQMNADIKAEADKYPDIKVIFNDAQNDVLTQRAQIEEFVSAGVDLLIVSPLESQPLTEPIRKVVAAGIPVIVLDRDTTEEVYTQFIGADNTKIAKALGEWVAENYDGKGAKLVELMGLQTVIAGRERRDGFRSALEGTDIELIFEADMKWLEASARAEMESALSRYDKIDIVYGHNDPGAHGAYVAAKASGREKEIIFIGIDALPHEGLAYVRDGILSATMLYPTGGDIAIQQARKILAGEPVEKRIVLGTKLYTADNIESGGQEIN